MRVVDPCQSCPRYDLKICVCVFSSGGGSLVLGRRDPSCNSLEATWREGGGGGRKEGGGRREGRKRERGGKKEGGRREGEGVRLFLWQLKPTHPAIYYYTEN